MAAISKPVKRDTVRDRVLVLLEKSGWLTTPAVAARVGVSSSTLHTVLRALVREKLVDRRPSPDGSPEVEWKRSTAALADIASETKRD